MANPNTAKFPAALAGDIDLAVATNSFSTTLTNPIDASTLTIVVGNGDLSVPAIIRIDSEFILIESKNSLTLTVKSDGRGFDSSSAATHSAGAQVDVFVQAYHFNQLAAEVKAIETFFGVSGANVIGAGATGPTGPQGPGSLFPAIVTYKGGVVQAGSASIGFSTPSTGAPDATAILGTNVIMGVASFGTVEYVQDHFTIPLAFTGTDVTVKAVWYSSSATSGNCQWEIYFASVAETEDKDPAWGSANSLVDIPNGTVNKFNVVSGTFTITGIAAGEELFFKFGRKSGSDTMSGDGHLVSLDFSLPRA